VLLSALAQSIPVVDLLERRVSHGNSKATTRIAEIVNIEALEVRCFEGKHGGKMSKVVAGKSPLGGML